jgi:putative ABC transport system permease protein
LIVAINVVNTSVLAEFRRTIDLVAGPSHLQVRLGVGEIGFPEELAQLLEQDPDVLSVVPLVRGTVSLASDPTHTLQLFGANLLAEEDLERYQVTTLGPRKNLFEAITTDPRSIFVTVTFARHVGLEIGDQLTLAVPHGFEQLTVRGFLEPRGWALAFGGQLAVMDLPAAQLLLHKEGRVDQLDLVLRDGTDHKAVLARLRRRIPATLDVTPPAERAVDYERVLSSFQAMLAGLSTLSLVAGVFVVYNTTSTGTSHRATSLARMRVIGAAATRVFRLLMLEAFILSTLGTLLGTVIGLTLAVYLSGMVTESMGIIFQLRFPVDTLVVDHLQLAVIATLGVGAGLFASYFAARRASTLEPLAVLRRGPRLYSQSTNLRHLVAWWFVLVGVSALALVLQEYLGSPAWGNFGATLWNASVIVIAVPLVHWTGGLLTRLLPRYFGPYGQLAAESLLRSPTRTGVTSAAIGLVLTVAIMLSSLSFSFRESMKDYIGRFFAADIIVSAVTTEGGWLETPLPERVVSEMLEIPGVRAVETFRVLPGQLYRGQRIAVTGLSEGFFEPSRYPQGWYREGDASQAKEALRSGNAVNISTGLSDRANLHVGDQLDLDTPTGRLALPIVGVVPDYISDQGTVLLSRRLVVERWGEPTVSRINVTIDHTATLEEVRDRIAKRFGREYLLKILSLPDLLAYHSSMINRGFAFTKAIQLLVIIVTVAGIFDLLVSAIVERRRELSLWRLIGADESAVRRCVMLESATIGALGSLLGITVGLVTAWLWIRFNFRHLLGYYLEQHFDFASVLWYLALVMIMTTVAGYSAAHQATRQDVIEGIQTE